MMTMPVWYIFGRSHGKAPCIKYQFHVNYRITNKRYLSAVDWNHLEGIIKFCCDGLFSLLMVDGSVLFIEVGIGAADDRHNKKASKITMQR
jgi:hypothetical protein